MLIMHNSDKAEKIKRKCIYIFNCLIYFFFKDFRNIVIVHCLKINICVKMKNKINNYDFLIVGAGLIGAIAALALFKKNSKF